MMPAWKPALASPKDTVEDMTTEERVRREAAEARAAEAEQVAPGKAGQAA